jgi:hypothetical protein
VEILTYRGHLWKKNKNIIVKWRPLLLDRTLRKMEIIVAIPKIPFIQRPLGPIL